MTTWQIPDTQETLLPDFDIAWLPPSAYQYVTPHLHNSRDNRPQVGLEASTYVGTLPLLNGDTLVILPRVGQYAFSRMLYMSEGLENALPEGFEGFAKLTSTAGDEVSWLALLARSFMAQLRLIEKRSPLFIRRRVTTRHSYSRGKPDIPTSMLNLAAKQPLPIVNSYTERQYGTAENRMLSTAVAILQRDGFIRPEDFRSVAYWLAFLDENRLTQAEFRSVLSNLQAKRYTGPRSYYMSALLMARLIIAQGDVSLVGGEVVDTEPVLTNLPILYERYIRSVIAKEFTPRGYLVTKPSGKSVALFLDGTCEMTPDITIAKDGQVILVGDTKYKPNKQVPPADYYQMRTYLDGFGATRGVLIMPVDEDLEPSLLLRRTITGQTIAEIRVPLSRWQESEQFIIRSFTQTLLA